jgi:anti-anti-sigma factor
MEMQFSEVDGVTKAALGGKLNTESVSHATQGEAYFIAHIPKEQSAVVDMSNVVTITSLGVRMLINTAKALGPGHKLALYGTNDNVMDILENTDLIEIIAIVDTEAEAVAAVLV